MCISFIYEIHSKKQIPVQAGGFTENSQSFRHYRNGHQQETTRNQTHFRSRRNDGIEYGAVPAFEIIRNNNFYFFEWSDGFRMKVILKNFPVTLTARLSLISGFYQ